MRSPVSSRFLLVLADEALEGAVLAGVVGDAVLPAVPHDGEPGAGSSGGARGCAELGDIGLFASTDR